MIEVPILLKKKRFNLAMWYCETVLSYTCSSDHDKLNVVRVTHDMDAKTCSPQEGSELKKKSVSAT